MTQQLNHRADMAFYAKQSKEARELKKAQIADGKIKVEETLEEMEARLTPKKPYESAVITNTNPYLQKEYEEQLLARQPKEEPVIEVEKDKFPILRSLGML